MKRFLILLIAILFIKVVSGQNNMAILGTGSSEQIVLIFHFEVLDSESQWPISGAKIILQDYERAIFSLSTNSEGKAIVLVKNRVGNFPGGKLKVTAEGYRFSEQSMSQWDYVREPGPRIGIPTSNWEINDRLVINTILSENFHRLYNRSITSSDLVNVGDYFKITIDLQKIPEYR